jgi:hypothetical protein
LALAKPSSHCLAAVGAGGLESRGLMIDKREILEAASSFSLLPNVVEKDYVLGGILAGIDAHEELAESWAFKGGTYLNKCYFETYRFSEDLDFTLRDENHLDEEFLKPVFEEVVAWVTEQSGLNIPTDQLEFDIYDNRRGKPNSQGKIAYRGPVSRREVLSIATGKMEPSLQEGEFFRDQSLLGFAFRSSCPSATRDP